MLKVLFATSEATPYAQTGGLAEVCGSLPKYLAARACEVRVVMPGYHGIDFVGLGCTPVPGFSVPGYAEKVQLWRAPQTGGVSMWFVDTPVLFARPGTPYGDTAGHDWSDNAYRFAYFSHAVAQLARGGGDAWIPDVVHAHDWQTGLVALLLSGDSRRPGLVFTIHNLAYQGICDRETFTYLHLPFHYWHPEALEFYGNASLIKGGIAFADRITTVSPNYAREIQGPDQGYGLDGLLRRRADRLVGILNGIDYEVWNPERDPLIAQPYAAATLTAKLANKRALQQMFGLPTDAGAFLLGTVSRLVAQKGIDLILAAWPQLRDLRLQLIVLGSGEAPLEAALTALAAAEPQRVACRIGYDTRISHAMFAGLDAMLMPSRFEPCGLGQLYALRYGALPVARRTGGLADSLIDAYAAPAAHATGFMFDEATASACANAIRGAEYAYRSPALWQQLQRNGMSTDFSWERSAREYLRVYAEVARVS